MTPLMLDVLRWTLPILLGPAVYAMSRDVLNLSTTIDYLPAIAKRGIVVMIGVALSALLAWLHLTTPDACAALTNVSADVMAEARHACALALNTKVPLQGLTASGVAMLMHALKKSNPRN